MVSQFLYLIFTNNKKEKFIARPGRLKYAWLAGWLVMVLLQMTLASAPSFGQKKNLSYKVVQNTNNIGWIKLYKFDTENTSRIQLESVIKKRIIFLLSVIEKQDVLFNNGLMVKSNIFRKVNDDVKMDTHTSYAGTFYEVRDQNSLQRIMIERIDYNLLSMYFREPVNITHVYSDSFQCLLKIENTGNSSYKIRLPDGYSNYYYYIDGICSRIRLVHTFFTIEFIRV